MNSKHEVKTSARAAGRQTRAKWNTGLPLLHEILAGRRKQPAAGLQPLPSGAPPAYEELLQFFNASSDLFCIAGFDGKFKRLNPAWHAGLGWTLEELQARPFLDFVHPDDRPATRAEMDKLATGAATIAFDNRYRCKDGSWKWLQWSASPLTGRQEIYAIARDVTEQKRLEEEILDTLDLERERMGRELHDGLCQNMAGIAALSATLARRLAPAAAPEASAAREIGELLGQSIQHARDLARGLDPLHLEGIGLAAALADFCLNTEALFKITCRFHCECSVHEINGPAIYRTPHCGFDCEDRPRTRNANREAHLYRIAQEAVNNAIAHGRAKRIEVSLAFRNGQGTLTIRDDGLGIGGQLNRRRGIGLQTMAYRARVIGGSLELNRRAPRGTAVTCVFPLSPAAAKP